MRPNCITCNKMGTKNTLIFIYLQILYFCEAKCEFERLKDQKSYCGLFTFLSSIFFTCLLCTVLNLEVFGRLLGDSASKVQLVNLAVLVPHGRFVVHHNFSVSRDIARRRIVFASSKLQVF